MLSSVVGLPPDQSEMSSQIHHKFRRCPLKDCDYFGGDLKRHLSSKKHTDDVDANLIEALVQVADKGKKKKGPNRMLFRWCPLRGCSFLTCYLRKHLRQAHGITNSEKLNRLRGKSILYQPRKLPCETPVDRETDTDTDDDEDESDDDEDQDYEAGKKSYFQTQSTKTVRHRLLVDFYNYLGTVDEGEKEEHVRFQHAYQMRKILEGVDPDGKDIDMLAGDEGRAIWNLWFAPRLKDDSVKAGTLLSYLGSVNKFLKFIVKCQNRRQRTSGGPRLSQETCEILSDTANAIPGWRNTILKHRSIERSEHYLKECDRRLTREDLQAFLQSPVITEAEALFDGSTSIHRKMFRFTRARDYLITRLAVSCGTRPKPLETATIEHFKQARRDAEFERCFVMLVPKHKRQMDGPAIVTMDETLHKLIENYIENIRPAIVFSIKERHLFVKMDGQPFKPGTIGTRITELWSKSGVRPDLSVSCTDFRKCIVTMIEESNKAERIKTGHALVDDGDVRRLLSHSQQTAALWYMRENLTAIGARAHTAVQRIWRSDSNDPGPSSRPDFKNDPKEKEQEQEDAVESDEESTMDIDRSDQIPSSVLLPLAQAEPQPPLPVPPIVTSTTQAAAARPADLPLLARPRARRQWSRQDSALFVQFVKASKGKCPGSQEVYDGFCASPVLKNILEREGILRCIQKVRNTFKNLLKTGDHHAEMFSKTTATGAGPTTRAGTS